MDNIFLYTLGIFAAIGGFLVLAPYLPIHKKESELRIRWYAVTEKLYHIDFKLPGKTRWQTYCGCRAGLDDSLLWFEMPMSIGEVEFFVDNPKELMRKIDYYKGRAKEISDHYEGRMRAERDAVARLRAKSK